MTYVHTEEPLPEERKPTIVLVNDQNMVEEIIC